MNSYLQSYQKVIIDIISECRVSSVSIILTNRVNWIIVPV